MRDYELELIAALVEGRLDDEKEARALIDASPEHHAEYEAQKLAYDVLRDQGTVAMSNSERADLHRDVWTALRADTEVKPARGSWYYRWAPVAAGMFVVVGVVAVLNQGGADSDGEMAPMAADSADDGRAGTTETEEPTTFDLTAEEAEEADMSDTTIAADEDREVPERESDEAFYAAEAESLRMGRPTGATVVETYDADTAPSELQTCVGEAGFDGYEVMATLTVPDDGDSDHVEATPLIAAKPEEAELDSAPLVFIDSETCELIHFDE